MQYKIKPIFKRSSGIPVVIPRVILISKWVRANFPSAARTTNQYKKIIVSL